MDNTTRCFHCGERMVAVMSMSGRTDLHCVGCDDASDVSLVPGIITEDFLPVTFGSLTSAEPMAALSSGHLLPSPPTSPT